MSGNTFGTMFRVTTFGESHGAALGAVIDGCPAGLALTTEDIQPALDRRRPGQSAWTTQRREADQIQILSGTFEGYTTGAPIALLLHNHDAKPEAYDHLRDVFRPGHADFTWSAKHGLRDHRGGGRASARETAARVAAGAVAAKWLQSAYHINVIAYVESLLDVSASIDPESVSREAVEASPLRCPDPETSSQMLERLAAIRQAKDSAGGTIRCIATGAPAGWGEPVFDRVDALLAYAMLSIPASKGFEMGSGFQSCTMTGSAHNDAFYTNESGEIRTRTNHAGGSLGGITTGMPIVFRVAFKPVATHFLPQESVTTSGAATTFSARGRHDPCVLPRAVPIVEAMTWLTLADLAAQHAAYTHPVRVR